MRLSAEQIKAIKQETELFFGVGAQVWLFGSRVDDTKKGGDIDLYVCPGTSDAEQLVTARFAFLARLKQRIGDQKIDLVLQREGGEELPGIYDYLVAIGRRHHIDRLVNALQRETMRDDLFHVHQPTLHQADRH